MFSRALRTSRAAPLRSNAFSKAALVKRTVTTDAASAHADKDSVPEVRFLDSPSLEQLNDSYGWGKLWDRLLMRLLLQEDTKTFQVHLSDESFETYELDPPPYTLDTTKAELKQMYYDMVATRYALEPFSSLPMGH